MPGPSTYLNQESTRSPATVIEKSPRFPKDEKMYIPGPGYYNPK